MSAEVDCDPPIPTASTLPTLDAFREWMHTAAPDRGRFWYVRWKFESDMSPEKISVHNFGKAALYGTLVTCAQKHDLGEVFPDGVFLVNQAADLGTEPDMVVQIVSDSSVRKDKVELRKGYFDAGIPEYWLIDARGDEIDFQLLVRGDDDYAALPADAKGYFLSPCFGRRFLLSRKAHTINGWSYRLLTRAE